MQLGFYNVWLNQGVGNYNEFMSLLKQRFKSWLTDNFVQNWSSRLDIPLVRFSTGLLPLLNSRHI